LSRWTQEREAELKQRWSKDPSTTRIARAMGVTRNTIIGKSRALNLHYGRTGRALTLDSGHPAVRGARTLFPGQAHDPSASERLLKPGEYQRKLGGCVTKGAWRGMPIVALSLEERATCPRTCAMFNSCYGNGMAHAVRFRHGAELERHLWVELGKLQRRNPLGFVVRLHVLGDFYSVRYVDFWVKALAAFPALHVFGYSAWPHHTKIGRAVKNLRDAQWDRFAVRTSGALTGPRTVVIEKAEDKPEGAIICPAQTGKTLACGTCGLCWAEAARERTVAFLRH
jgi:hypothetical protein